MFQARVKRVAARTGSGTPNGSAWVGDESARTSRSREGEHMSGLDDYDQPATVVIFEGSVLIWGPAPITAAFTPDAAEATGQRLIEAAARARLYAADRT